MVMCIHNVHNVKVVIDLKIVIAFPIDVNFMISNIMFVNSVILNMS